MLSTSPFAVVGKVLLSVVAPSSRYGCARIVEICWYSWNLLPLELLVALLAKRANIVTKRSATFDGDSKMSNLFEVVYDTCCRRG